MIPQKHPPADRVVRTLAINLKGFHLHHAVVGEGQQWIKFVLAVERHNDALTIDD